LLVIVATFPLTRACDAADETVVRVTYTETHNRVLPFPEVTSTGVSLEVHLSVSGKVDQRERRASGRARGGDNLSLRLGQPRELAWRVAGPNKLINIKQYFTYSRAIEVTVADGGCTARVGYNLKPGQHDYQYPRLHGGARATATAVSANSISCSIH
jgi:hypothetical protein